MSGALGLAFATGVALGAFYFGSLWLVVRRLERVARPALWLGVTGVLRLGVALLVFALLAGAGWDRVVAALIGLLLVRGVLTRWLGRPQPGAARLGRGRAAVGGDG